MPSVYRTRHIDADQQTVWKIISDLTASKDWQVVSAGRVTDARIIQDAGVLTRSIRRIEVEGSGWLEEEVTEASAPSYVAFKVLRDSTGNFNRTYKDMTISVRVVGASGGGVNVTLGVAYTKASFIGRWTDWFGPRNWRGAFGKSLENLAQLVSHAKPELFTPTWRQPAERPAAPVTPAPAVEVKPAEPPAMPEPAEAPPPAPADAFVSVKAEAEVETPAAETAARAELEQQLARLRSLLDQSRELGLPTAEIEARIADIEARLGG